MAVAAERTNFTFSMDKKTRDAFSMLCEEIGIPMSAALNGLVKQAVRQQKLSFSLIDVNGFTPSEAAEFRRRIKDVEQGHIEEHPLKEV